MIWNRWKQGFTAWEAATSQYTDKLLASPAMLRPAASLLSAVMKAKAAADRVTSAWWSVIGLPTRKDQERSLHKLNQLESRLFDLEERLTDQVARAAGPGHGE